MDQYNTRALVERGRRQLREKSQRKKRNNMMTKEERIAYTKRTRNVSKTHSKIDQVFDDLHANNDEVPEQSMKNIRPEDLYDDIDKLMDERDIDTPSKHTQIELKNLDRKLKQVVHSRCSTSDKPRLGTYIQKSVDKSDEDDFYSIPNISVDQVKNTIDPFLMLSNDPTFRETVLSSNDQEYTSIRTIYNLLDPMKYLDQDDDSLLFSRMQWHKKMELHGCVPFHEVEMKNGSELLICHKISGPNFVTSYLEKILHCEPPIYQWRNYTFSRTCPETQQ